MKRYSFFVIPLVFLFSACTLPIFDSSKLPLTVEFSLNYSGAVGSVPSTSVEKGGFVEKPEDPTREDYSFDGWYRDAATSIQWDFSTDTVSHSMKLYAKWTDAGTIPEPSVYLASLSVSQGSLSPVFSAKTTSYSVNVDNGVTSVIVAGVAADASSTVSGPVVLSSLVEGISQVAKITVTASDNAETSCYTVIVTRAPADVSGPYGTVSASRTSGVAPLYVHFSADFTGDPAAAIGFRRYDYSWDFGDSSGDTWGTTGKSKNSAKGGVAAHVFETAGTYQVVLTVRNQSGVVGTESFLITVQDPDVVYTGNKTICVSDTSHNSFAGAPAGSRHVTTDNLSTVLQYATAGSRILFQRGSSWSTGNLDWPGNAGPVTIGAYGAGSGLDSSGIYSNAPAITVTSGHFIALNQKQDWRIMDLRLIDASRRYWAITGDYEMQRNLVLRVKTEGFCDGIQLSHWNTNAVMTIDQIAVVSCDLSDAYNNVMYIGAERLALLGNTIKNARTSHVLRVWQGYRGVVSGNLVSGASLANSQGLHALKLHGPGPGSGLGTPSPNNGNLKNKTEYLVVSDNVFGGSGPWPVAVGPTSSEWDEQLSDVIFERNRILSQYGAQNTKVDISLIIWARYTAVRNNIIDGTGSNGDYTGILVDRRGVEPAPVGVEVYNNTIYRSDNTSGTERIGIRIGGASSGTIVNNNLVSYPGATVRTVQAVRDDGSKSVVSANLLSSAALFVNAIDSDPIRRDFSVQAGSPAINYGISVPVHDDYSGSIRPINGYDAGAYER